MDKKHILFINMDAPASDKRCWSGTAYNVYNGLSNLYDIDAKFIKSNCSILANICCLYRRYIKKEFISIKMTKFYSLKSKKIISRFLKRKRYDLIFCINNPGAIANLKTNIPIIYYSDCVTSNMFDYYWYGSTEKGRKEMNDITQKALDVSREIILSNNWAKAEAESFYKIDKKKMDVIPFGANIEEESIEKKQHEGINLLFIGVDWERKGAQIAIDCVDKLNELNPTTKYTLHLVGCLPQYEVTSPNVVIHGFLRKTKEVEKKKLDSLRAITDFFILPTKAECSAIVFCEAAAYGLPSITYDTGGLGDYVINGYNGYRLDLESGGEEFAKKILEISSSPQLLEKLKNNSREMYNQNLNWNVSCERIKAVLDRVMKS